MFIVGSAHGGEGGGGNERSFLRVHLRRAWEGEYAIPK